MKTLIAVSYYNGGIEIKYEKIFMLPFIPFIGLTIYDQDEKEENETYINLLDDSTSVSTDIIYDHKKEMFIVHIKRIWDDYYLTKRIIENETDRFIKTEWKAIHTNEDLERIKKRANKFFKN